MRVARSHHSPRLELHLQPLAWQTLPPVPLFPFRSPSLSHACTHPRDIKPENILFSRDMVLKLGDFGLAIDIGQEKPVTRAGTLDYMVSVCARIHASMSLSLFSLSLSLSLLSLCLSSRSVSLLSLSLSSLYLCVRVCACVHLCVFISYGHE